MWWGHLPLSPSVNGIYGYYSVVEIIINHSALSLWFLASVNTCTCYCCLGQLLTFICALEEKIA